MPKLTPKTKKQQDKQKEIVLNHAKAMPIISALAKKVGVSRNTIYRWQKEDAAFKKAFLENLGEGIEVVNDLAESGLIQLIKERKLGAIIYWLKHHHDQYRSKVEISAFIQEHNLSNEQQSVIFKALKLTQGEDGKKTLPPETS